MTVEEFIKKLSKFDQKLPVCIADWNEDYALPREDITEKIIEECNGRYVNKYNEFVVTPFLCIG